MIIYCPDAPGDRKYGVHSALAPTEHMRSSIVIGRFSLQPKSVVVDILRSYYAMTPRTIARLLRRAEREPMTYHDLVTGDSPDLRAFWAAFRAGALQR